LLAFLVIVAFAIIRRRSLITTVMLSSFFSLLMAGTFVLLDAVDVAFAEAAVGAGITTVLLLSAVALTSSVEVQPLKSNWLALVLTISTAGVLFYGVSDLPAFGDAAAPAQRHVAPRYLEMAELETGIPNVVTSVLASYRGYDTFGELTVVLTAGIGVMLLMSPGVGRRRTDKKSDEDAT
jgi:multicomponent Na+:H+ antiporter subunit B